MSAPQTGAKSTHTQLYESFVRLLRLTRQEVGMSQAELAKRLGKPQNYVSKCETAERRIDLVEWLLWMEAVDARPAVFLRRLRQPARRKPMED